mgnify:CR=1 FL=1|tara:strand:+ start:54 stop:689 length:636 start_codon:yes stop_codon:yes gene_type:complete
MAVIGPVLQGLGRLGKGIASLRGRRSLSGQTDDILKVMQRAEGIQAKTGLGQIKKLSEIAARQGRESQALIDSVSRTSSIASQKAYTQQAQALISKSKEIQSISNLLENQYQLANSMGEARLILQKINQMRKLDGKIKAALVALGAGGGGMFFGASQQRKNPEFYNPETSPFKDLFSSPDVDKYGRSKGAAYDAVGEAINDMDNKVNGREQ